MKREARRASSDSHPTPERITLSQALMDPTDPGPMDSPAQSQLVTSPKPALTSRERLQVQDVYNSDTDEELIPPQSPPRPPSASQELFETLDPTAISVISPEGSSSSDDTSSDEEEVQPSQVITDSKSSPPQPVDRTEWLEAAMRIPIPDLFHWIASQTNFTVNSVSAEVKRPRMALSSSALLPTLDKPEPFLGLSSSPGIVSSVAEISQAFAAHRPQSMRSLIGKYVIPGQLFNVNMATFKLGDKEIGVEWLKNPPSPPEFIMPMQANYSTVVREDDLRRLEENSRKSLVVLSNMDATLSALLNAYPSSSEPDSNFMRALFRMTLGMQALTELVSASLHQVVLHRRDGCINAKLNNKSKPMDISEDHLTQLRYGPFLGQQFLFDPDILLKIQAEREVDKTQKLTTSALSRIAFDVHRQFQPKAAEKRPPPAATVSVPPERQRAHKKPKLQSAQSAPQPKAKQFPSGQAQPPAAKR